MNKILCARADKSTFGIKVWREESAWGEERFEEYFYTTAILRNAKTQKGCFFNNNDFSADNLDKINKLLTKWKEGAIITPNCGKCKTRFLCYTTKFVEQARIQ
jgi:hypothetical protein